MSRICKRRAHSSRCPFNSLIFVCSNVMSGIVPSVTAAKRRSILASAFLEAASQRRPLCRMIGRKRVAVSNCLAKQSDQAFRCQKLIRQSAKNEPVRLCFGNRGWSLRRTAMIHRDRRWIMRFDLSDEEWTLLELLVPNSRKSARAGDLRIRNGGVSPCATTNPTETSSSPQPSLVLSSGSIYEPRP